MKIYNTLTRKKEEFVPIHEGKVGIYSCGPTVYNYFHIGNARPFIIFDTLRRYLEYKGYEVTFVQNFTDIDDKMIKKANEEGITVAELADRYIKEYYKDAEGLGVRKATVAPLATHHINEMVDIIQKLIDKGLAYEVNGDVYYSVNKFKDYGKLSGQPLENLREGARVEPGSHKKDPMDFALWKAKKEGEPSWETPWGEGRPGWHIECSAMSMKYLGEEFDIHSGGVDLTFPHHENEIAQSEGATGKPFARYWMHNGHINVNNEKMSKSLNNFFTVRDISKEFDLQAVRLFMLSAHYRNPINFSKELIEQATAALGRLKNARMMLDRVIETGEQKEADSEFVKSLDGYRKAFCDAMDDDLNTADAVGAIFELVREINTYFNTNNGIEDAKEALTVFEELTGVLGLETKSEDTTPKEVLELAQKRQEARESKDYQAADKIRDQLKDLGYVVEDTSNGPVVKKI